MKYKLIKTLKQEISIKGCRGKSELLGPKMDISQLGFKQRVTYKGNFHARAVLNSLSIHVKKVAAQKILEKSLFCDKSSLRPPFSQKFQRAFVVPMR